MLKSLVVNPRRNDSVLEMQEASGWEPIPRNGGGDPDLADYALVPSESRGPSYSELP